MSHLNAKSHFKKHKQTQLPKKLKTENP